jgi:hypothetical protein
VSHPLGKDTLEMSATEDQRAIEALPTNRANEALGEGVGPRCPHWSAGNPDAV